MRKLILTNKERAFQFKRRGSLVTISLVILTLLILALIPAKLVVAQASKELRKSSQKHAPLVLVVGKSHLMKFSSPITKVSVGDPEIADVLVAGSNELYLLGKKTGSTNVMVWRGEDAISILELVVAADVTAIQELIEKLLPTEKNIRVSPAGASLVLTGIVTDALRVQQAVKITEEFSGKKVINMMSTQSLPQVLIEVKIAEVKKDIMDTLGFNVSGSDFAFAAVGGATIGASSPVANLSPNVAGQFGSTNAWIQAQIATGALTLLAEPNIMAISGQEGQFLAGGKVFLPITQSNAVGGSPVVTLQEQSYGVGIKFTPTVLDGGRINLKINPEVSEVSTQGIPVVSGNSTTILPTIFTRQASTTVQLQDGQSFAIGGLIKSNVTEVISAFPGLASIPVLGALFRSSSFSAGRTELLIIVTPRIVQALNKPPKLPTDNFKQPTPSEFFLEGKMEGTKTEPKVPVAPTEPTTSSVPNLSPTINQVEAK